MNGSRNLGALVGRILLVLIFVISGFGKIKGFAGAAGYMQGAGIPAGLVTPALILTILVEFGGGLLIVVGFRTRLAAVVLFLWLIPVTYIFHFIPYHKATPPDQVMTNMIMIMKNISMMGGLLFLASMGPGAYSVEGNGD